MTLDLALQLPTTAPLQVAGYEWARTVGLQLLGLVLAGGVVATLLAAWYRRGTTRPLPSGVGPFLALATVGTWLLVDVLVRGAVVEGTPLDHVSSATYLLVAAALGTGAGAAGRRLGDRIACDVYEIDRLSASGPQAERLRSARLLVPVTFPDAVADAEGYLPVDDETKRALAGSSMLFPSTLDEDELAERVESRIRTDYDVDHVGVALDGGDVESLTLGRERAGLGPHLPPGTVAITVRGDPAADAAPGDAVELWDGETGTSRLVARGRLHARSGDLTTVVVPEDAAGDVDPTARYRVVVPPDAPDDRDRLIALVRSAPETTVQFDVERGGPLEGEFVGWLPGTTVAVERDDAVIAFPEDNETLTPGDVAYCFGHPDDLRDFEGAEDGATGDSAVGARTEPPTADD